MNEVTLEELVPANYGLMVNKEVILVWVMMAVGEISKQPGMKTLQEQVIKNRAQ